MQRRPYWHHDENTTCGACADQATWWSATGGQAISRGTGCGLPVSARQGTPYESGAADHGDPGGGAAGNLSADSHCEWCVVKLTGNTCLCRACGEYFRSVTAFEKHRIGTFRPLTRRCMTVDEMKATQMEQRGRFW